MTITRQNDSPEVIGWRDHIASWDWQQGEHVTLVGPTKAGKSTLTKAILEKRDYVVFVATKPKDPIVDELEADGFRVIREWPRQPPQDGRLVLWPKIEHPADLANQQRVIKSFLEDAYTQGGWTIVLDELRYITGKLQLQHLCELLWLQGRSLGITVVGGSQRPRHVPLEAYSQAAHLYLWETRDRQDLRRLAEFSGRLNPYELAKALEALPDHACLYAGADGTMRITGVGMIARKRRPSLKGA